MTLAERKYVNADAPPEGSHAGGRPIHFRSIRKTEALSAGVPGSQRRSLGMLRLASA